MSFASRICHHLGRAVQFYIEAGAFNGLSQSQTLECAGGCKGILIEPNPTIYGQLVHNRPNDICLPFCLVSDPARKSTRFFCCDFMSLAEGTRGSLENDLKWIRDGEYAQGIAHKAVEVPCRTLGSILDEHGSPQVDWFSLDVEGGELEVLRGLGHHRPLFISLELSHLIEETKAYLVQIGYEFVEALSDHDFLYRLANRS